MSKSIFIIDTPACCGECPMSCTDVCRKWSRKDAKTFLEDCPLEPAYDVDKVVEQLEEKLLYHEERLEETGWAEDKGCIESYKYAIKIVKSGGIE